MEEVKCQHQWKISTANGPRSQGICSCCGEERSFLNYFPMVEFGQTTEFESQRHNREFLELVRRNVSANDLLDPYLEEGEVRGSTRND